MGNSKVHAGKGLIAMVLILIILKVGAQPYDYTEPDISPNGMEIVFCSSNGNNNAIYIATIDGSDLRRIVNLPEYESSPSWSPDGSRIIFYSMNENGDSDIYVVDKDGNNIRNITNGKWPHVDGVNWIKKDGVLFSNGKFPSSNVFSFNGEYLSEMNQLTDTIGLNYGADLFDDRLIYSVFSKLIKGLHMKNLSTGVTSKLIEHGERGKFSPNGKWIAYQRRVDGIGQVHVLNRKKGSIKKLTDNVISELPTWAPNGKFIYYQCKSDGAYFSIWRMKRNGTKKVKIIG